jgi:hypothetical protein
MRNIDTSIIAKLANGTFRPFDLLELVIDGKDYRYTDCDVDITLPDHVVTAVEDLTLKVGGDLDDGIVNEPVPRIYAPLSGFKYTPIKYSMVRIVDKATIEFLVIDLPDMILAFAGGTPQGSLAIIRRVLVDDDYSLVSGTSAMVFEGTIDGWNMTEDILKITVVSQFVQWSQRALRLHSPSCPWKVFGGNTPDSPCMYSGSEIWCDRTYVRCTALGNTANYGGFRWLPSIVDKEIWWGMEKA